MKTSQGTDRLVTSASKTPSVASYRCVRYLRRAGAEPSTLVPRGFPKTRRTPRPAFVEVLAELVSET